MHIRPQHLVLLLLFAIGCAAIGGGGVQLLLEGTGSRSVVAVQTGSIDYWADVKPILDRRCAVCHGCYDAPCQLKLQSVEGLERGATQAKIYAAARLRAVPPTRLYEDAITAAEWRGRGFFGVLDEPPGRPNPEPERSLMHRMLELKERNPLPPDPLLPESFDLSLGRSAEVCPTPDAFDEFAETHPLWGMPYGLPRLADSEQEMLVRWIGEGATYVRRPALDDTTQKAIERWETFLNGQSHKERLMSRYVFEHLFLAHLYFGDVLRPGDRDRPDRGYFRLFRSRTPPGEPIDPIASVRPFDDPGVDAFYYRLAPEHETILAKTHLPYRLDAARMTRWNELFLRADYEVSELPSYEPEVASNPLLAFEGLPIRSRYRFMLDEARFTIANFIKGPVCRGQVSLNVINDHFWVFFFSPDLPEYDAVEKLLEEIAPGLPMPAAEESNIFRLRTHWRAYRDAERKYQRRSAEFRREHFGPSEPVTLDLLWDGNGENPNAALTIFRHFDSATVEQGLLGGSPKTAWIVSYSLLERIHYLLVAGFDVYGNLGHQLLTRNYMDFLRMHGEANFLTFLPEPARTEIGHYWYRGASEEVMSFFEPPPELAIETGIDFQTDDPQRELYSLLEQRLRPVLSIDAHLLSLPDGEMRDQLERLSDLVGGGIKLLPPVTLLEIRGASGSEWVTLLRNNAHKNISSIFFEQDNRLPDEDRLSVLRGFVGAYPNSLLSVDASKLATLVDFVTTLRSEQDYRAFRNLYAIRRTNPAFWPHTDSMHRAYRARRTIDWGLLDFSRLENR